MPPNQSRSTWLFRIAFMISNGVAFCLSMPIAAMASGVSVTDFSAREMIMPPSDSVLRS
ncbi:hypothetical protein D3C87_1286460 [compost metagenome]